MPGGIRVSENKLKDWVARVFEKGRVPREHAEVAAEVLVLADIRGIETHGVARLPYYWRKLDNGTMNPEAHPHIINEMPSVALFDGDNGLGPVVGKMAMETAIDKARKTGAGLVSVVNSNHYGIAGYYSMMALQHGMIGISMTNALCLVAPTFGTKPILGTNPISMTAPADQELPFVLDMATSTVPAGKIEVALRENTGIPLGWLNDKHGKTTDQPVWMLQGGTLTPLGNDREHGGHKGYGLSLMVDILSAILSGANYGAKQEGLIRAGAGTEPSNVGHFFMALLIEGFRPLAEFKNTLDQALRALKDSAKIKGHDRIYVAGELEFMATEDSRKKGVPLSNVVVTTVTNLGNETGVPFDLA